MKIIGKIAILTVIGSCTAIVFAGQAIVQRSDFDGAENQPTATMGATDDGAAAQSPSAPAPQKTTADPGDNWHFSFMPYLWFAGMHGNVGAHGHEASVHADFGDIFSHLNIGLMAGAEARYKKFGPPWIFCG